MATKKGQKMTKSKKVREEEEARRLQEEEEARLQAEKEEQERLEREKKEWEQLELRDSQRRATELSELHQLLESNHTAVTSWKAECEERAQWERYMRCDGAPDPRVQQDVNTFISLWRDDPQASAAVVLQQCDPALQLMEELETLLRAAADPPEVQKYQEAVMELQDVIHSKHLLMAAHILKSARANVDAETGNMQSELTHHNMTLCLWANFTKNPRLTGLNFAKAGVSVELPKQLAVSDVAVRSLHTDYDLLSLVARMTHLRGHASSHRSLAGEEEAAEPKQGEGTEEEEVKGDETTQQQPSKEDQQPPPGPEGTKSEADGREGHVETQMEVLDAEGGFTSPPPQLSPNSSAESLQVVDLLKYRPLGGVFYYDVFHLPPQAHQVNDWEIRQLLEDTGLQTFPYPPDRAEDDGAPPAPPVGVSVKLPDSVVFLQPPLVARWDAAETQWRFDGITDVSYEEKEEKEEEEEQEAAKISFKLASFCPVVLLQETYANFPLQSWELRPLGQDSALLTITGALMDVSIMIQENQCLLQSKPEDSGLSSLEGTWMSVPALQRSMISAGINVFVNEHSHKYVPTCGKDPLTEHAAYEQMALFASACAFSWSRWNSRCGAEHLVVQACEHQDPAPVPDPSWSLYLLGAQRSQRLEMMESSDTYAPVHLPDSEVHSTFIHMLQDDMSADGIARTRASNFLFVDTVQSLLVATRPFMFSQ